MFLSYHLLTMPQFLPPSCVLALAASTPCFPSSLCHTVQLVRLLDVHGMQVAASVSEDALYLLFAELEKGLEDPVRRPAAAAVLTHFCATSKLDYQEHVPSLLTVSPCLTSLASLVLLLAPPGSYPFVSRMFLHCSSYAIVT